MNRLNKIKLKKKIINDIETIEYNLDVIKQLLNTIFNISISRLDYFVYNSNIYSK